MNGFLGVGSWPGKRAVLLGAALLSTACSTVYYRTLETVGIEKREILANRIEQARDAQVDAKDQFVSALDAYRALVDIDGGELEDVYDRLNSEFERSEARADDVRDRVAAVSAVAEDLFEEWDEENEQYTDADLRRQSQRLLTDTRGEYRRLMSAMQSASSEMDPVLALFRDQVLIMRHNLNARAIGALDQELVNVERATEALIREMERAIAEASRFMESTA